MAEEEVVASPPPSDNKRKLGDVERDVEERDSEFKERENGDDSAPEEAPEAKRAKVEENNEDGSVAEKSELQGQEADEGVKENEEDLSLRSSRTEDDEQVAVEDVKAEDSEKPDAESGIVEKSDLGNSQPDGDQSQAEGLLETGNSEQPARDKHVGDTQEASVKGSQDGTQQPVPETTKDMGHEIFQEPQSSEAAVTKRKMEVPNNKVGVLIGKAGDTIRYLQYNSGAKIQITRDADADLHSTTRPLEIFGTSAQIDKAEKLIKAVIAEADAGGSPSLVARGLASAQTTIASEQLEIQVPNEKVGLIIGRGGETIKGLQTRSGARIQIIPQHLAEGDDLKERTVRVTGDKRQVEMASELIQDVLTQPMKPMSFSGSVNQQMYRPRGPPGPPYWGARGPYFGQPRGSEYQQRGPYPPQNTQYPPGYGNYAPRSNFGPGWEQRPVQNMQGPPPHSGGYDYYGGPGTRVPEHPARPPAPAPSPSSIPAMGPPPSQSNYNYGQPQGPDYGQPGPYSQTAPQQSYGHGYNDQRYENQASQHSYGGHGNSQAVYPQAGSQPGYGPQQYGKPPSSYNMLPQGPPPQSYPPRAGHPGDVPYQSSVPASQPLSSNVPPQQQPYPYASSGPTQQTYPSYGSAQSADAYNQAPPAASSGYLPPGSQPAPNYSQPATQQAAAYPQAGATGAYGQYPQQGYPEQSANAAYAYQVQQDTSYNTGSMPTYNAPPPTQPAYAQATAQPSYDPSVVQPAAYGSVQGSTPGNYV